MVFSSVLFLFYFLAPLILIYGFIPQKYKNLTLFIVSLFFYAWGEPVYVFLMLFSAFFNYIIAFPIDKYRGVSKLPMIASCIVNIGLLGVFKYTDFAISTINGLFSLKLPLAEIALPIGISFYTFQALSYCIDVYRGKTKVQKSFVSFGMYLSFFPQLIAGPIVRYDDIANQVDNHPRTLNMFTDGVYRFCVGLAKKVLIANSCGKLWEITNIGADISALSAWLGIIAYTIQIYYDFSGYSDMAIGLGKMFGFEFCENFNYPYISRSITEFWRRWHISLSSWFKEYVYIPLGGSRVTDEKYKKSIKLGKLSITPAIRASVRRYLNIFIVWLLTGLWHGASFNFIAWGLYYGVLLILEKRFYLKKLEAKPRYIGMVYTMLTVIIGWVFFASPDFSSAFRYIGHMLNITNIGFTDSIFCYRLSSYAITFAVAIIGATPYPKKYFNYLTSGRLFFLRPLLAIAVLLLCTAYLVDNTYNPFLYFRF
jgi:alginate O-acetyltransferase complex protein AlgI